MNARESLIAARVPTVRQYGTLLSLGSGAAGLSRTKRDTDPLLRRGWVTAEWRAPYYQWVRITPDGLRALAVGGAKFGLPALAPKAQVQVCGECERDWRPICKCGGRSYRFVERDVAA